MDRIEPNDQRDFQPRFPRRLLHGRHLGRHDEIHHGAHLAGFDLADVEAIAAARQMQLPDLFRERHLAQQRIDSAFDRGGLGAGLPADRSLTKSECRHAHSEQDGDEPQDHGRPLG